MIWCRKCQEKLNISCLCSKGQTCQLVIKLLYLYNSLDQYSLIYSNIKQRETASSHVQSLRTTTIQLFSPLFQFCCGVTGIFAPKVWG